MSWMPKPTGIVKIAVNKHHHKCIDPSLSAIFDMPNDVTSSIYCHSSVGYLAYLLSELMSLEKKGKSASRIFSSHPSTTISLLPNARRPRLSKLTQVKI